MTVLNWEFKPDQVALLSDTLSLDGEDRRARGFTTKIYPAPHIGAVIAGTGVAPIVTRFYMSVVGDVFVNDVVHLSEFAPAMLRESWHEIASKLWNGATVTIYTFGLSEADGEFAGYAYRSANDFAAEPLPYGLAMKPGTFPEDLQAVSSMSDFVKLTRKQQAHDRATPRMERVGIGGDLWMYLLRKSADGTLSLQVDRIERMRHYDQDREMSLAKLSQNSNHPMRAAVLARDP